MFDLIVTYQFNVLCYNLSSGQAALFPTKENGVNMNFWTCVKSGSVS